MLGDQPIEPQEAAAVATAAGDFQHRQLAAQLAEADGAAVSYSYAATDGRALSSLSPANNSYRAGAYRVATICSAPGNAATLAGSWLSSLSANLTRIAPTLPVFTRSLIHSR